MIRSPAFVRPSPKLPRYLRKLNLAFYLKDYAYRKSPLSFIGPRKKGNGFDSSNVQNAQTAHSGLFMCVNRCCTFYGRQWQGGFGLPRILYVGLSTLLFAPHPPDSGSGSTGQRKQQCSTPLFPRLSLKYNSSSDLPAKRLLVVRRDHNNIVATSRTRSIPSRIFMVTSASKLMSRHNFML